MPEIKSHIRIKRSRVIRVTDVSEWNDVLTLFDFLWTGTIDGNYLINSIADLDGSYRKIQIVNKDFSTSYIPGTTTSTFILPNDADFILDDDYDLVWFDDSQVQRQVTLNELISYDFTKTLVKYSNSYPFNVTKIGILKKSIVLTQDQIDLLTLLFELPIMWSGIWNDNGRYKDNRELETSVWMQGLVFDDAALELFNRMANADGVDVTLDRKKKIDACIKNLISYNYFDTQWDNLYVLRGTGDGATRQNWIADNYNLTKGSSPVLVQDSGWHSNGVGYLKTGWSPRNNGVHYKQNDASYVLKTGGAVNYINDGVIGESSIFTGSVWDTAMNSASYQDFTARTRRVLGWNCNARNNSANFDAYRESAAYNFTKASLALPTYAPYILSVNNWGTPSGIVTATERRELVAYGKYITQAQFLEFKSIMETYFTSL